MEVLTNMSRVWAMPNSNTFLIPPIRGFITEYFDKTKDKGGWVYDPFVKDSPFKSRCITNDIDPDIKADYNLDALDFLVGLPSCSAKIVLFDPPYSPRQVSECYKKLDRTVNMQTTQSSFWSKLKKEIARIVQPGGYVLSFGWNSGGIGKKAGFEIVEIMLVAHGGWHNDTICTAEKEIK